MTYGFELLGIRTLIVSCVPPTVPLNSMIAERD